MRCCSLGAIGLCVGLSLLVRPTLGADQEKVFLQLSVASANKEDGQETQKTLLRRSTKITLEQETEFGDLEQDGVQLILKIQKLERDEMPAPKVFSHDEERIFIYHLRNAAVEDAVDKLHESSELDSGEKRATLIPDHGSNSLIVMGLSSKQEANFTAAVRNLDYPSHGCNVLTGTVKWKTANGQVRTGRLDGAFLESAKGPVWSSGDLTLSLGIR